MGSETYVINTSGIGVVVGQLYSVEGRVVPKTTVGFLAGSRKMQLL